MNKIPNPTPFDRARPRTTRTSVRTAGGAIKRWLNLGAAGGLLLIAGMTQAIDPLTTLIETRKFVAPDPTLNALFGYAVSIDGGTLVVSARQAGKVYVFDRNAGAANNWGQMKELVDVQGTLFGESVSLSGDILVVGAPKTPITTPVLQRYVGAAHVFGRNTGGPNNWGEIKSLRPSDAAANDLFGNSVSVDGDTLVVSAGGAGKAWVFGRNAGGSDNWGEVQEITASDASSVPDLFGDSVSISGDNLVVTAYGRGEAYVYGRNAGGPDRWGEVRILTAPAATPIPNFGYTVSLSGDSLAVGSMDTDTLVGAAFLFGRNVGGADNWGGVKTVAPSAPTLYESFGLFLSLRGGTLVVGAYERDGFDIGKAYVFGRDSGGTDNWGQLAKLMPSDGATGDYFGSSVATDGRTTVVGALLKDHVGAAYIYVGNAAPVARCHDVTVAAGVDCSAAASIDNGSSDPDAGDVIALSQSPAGPYPLGSTLVTLTVTDSQGLSSSCQSTVTVNYSWSGVLQPINTDGTSVFKAGSTVPVKFQLIGASAGIRTAMARLSYAKVSNSVPGPINEADAPGSATGGNLFEYDAIGGSYKFNWSTKGLTAGTYQLQINLGDGVTRTVNVALR